MLFRSMTTRMTLAVCTFVVFLLGIATFFTLGHFHKVHRATIADTQFALLGAIAQELESMLARTHGVLIAEARLLPAEAFSDAEATQSFLDERNGAHELFDNGLFLFSPTGDLIAESPFLPQRRGLNFAYRDYFQETVRKGLPHISSPYVSTKLGHPAIMMTVPLFDESGELLGILTGSLDLLRPNVLGQLTQVRIGRNGYLYLYGRDRTMIIHPDPTRIMQQDVPVGANRYFDLALEGFEGTGETVNSRGLRALASFKHLEIVPWILAANYPVEEAHAPLRQAQRMMLGGMAVATLLSIVLVGLMMRRMTRPLQEFTQHVERMEQLPAGEKSFHYRGRDELGTLVRTFNRMVDESERKRAQLHYLSHHDGLTSLYNRRYFEEEMKRLGRGRLAPITVIIADVNGLKKVNDTLGHSAGDALICAAARVLSGAFRAEDIVARIGGDEFAALLPGAGVQEAEKALSRIRERQRQMDLPQGLFLSIALGYAVAASPGDLEAALHEADARMYADKHLRSRGVSE